MPVIRIPSKFGAKARKIAKEFGLKLTSSDKSDDSGESDESTEGAGDENPKSEEDKSPDKDADSESPDKPDSGPDDAKESSEGRTGEEKTEAEKGEEEVEVPIDTDLLTEVHSRLLIQKRAIEEDKSYKDLKAKLDKKIRKFSDVWGDPKSSSEMAKIAKENPKKIDDLKKEEEKRDKVKAHKEKLENARGKRRFGSDDLLRMIKRFSSISKPLDTDEAGELGKIEEERLEFSDDWSSPSSLGPPRRSIIVHPVVDNSIIKRYALMQAEVRDHVAAMRNIFRLRLGERTVVEREKTEGRLDRRMLGRASVNPRIFKTSRKQDDKGLAICLLLDESGSMGTNYGRGNNRATLAGQCATLIAEALKGARGIKFEAYSYASCNEHDDNLVKYLYGKESPDIRGLGGYHIGGQNYDHVALEVAGKLFLRNTVNTNRLMIVLSDGAPCGNNYGGVPAIQRTRKSVQALEKIGITVINVAITNFRSDQMFTHVIKFLDLANLVTQMRRLITTIVRKATE